MHPLFELNNHIALSQSVSERVLFSAITFLCSASSDGAESISICLRALSSGGYLVDILTSTIRMNYCSFHRFHCTRLLLLFLSSSPPVGCISKAYPCFLGTRKISVLIRPMPCSRMRFYLLFCRYRFLEQLTSFFPFCILLTARCEKSRCFLQKLIQFF